MPKVQSLKQSPQSFSFLKLRDSALVFIPEVYIQYEAEIHVVAV